MCILTPRLSRERYQMFTPFFRSLRRHTPQGSKTIQIFDLGPLASAELRSAKEREGYKF